MSYLLRCIKAYNYDGCLKSLDEGTDPNEIDRDYGTPILFYAIGCYKIFELLLDRGAHVETNDRLRNLLEYNEDQADDYTRRKMLFFLSITD